MKRLVRELGDTAETLHFALLPCPSCGREVTAVWPDCTTGPQHCEACGHRFTATWPGFTFKPETVIVPPPGQEPRRGAA